MRAAYGALMHPARLTMRSVWNTWRNYANFFNASNEFRAEATRRKRLLVSNLWQQAGECQLAKDAEQWYQRIQKLCPKARRERIHLHADQVIPLSPEESATTLQQCCQGLFMDDAYQPAKLPPLEQVPFSWEEIQ